MLESSQTIIVASLCWFLLQVPEGLAQAPAPVKKDEALPPGALLRLGTSRFRHGSEVTSLAFSPNGKILASADATGVVRLADSTNGRPLLELPKGTGKFVLFTPDGKHLICGTAEKSLALLDATTGKVIRTFGERPHSHQRSDICNIALSGDGKAIAQINFREVDLWDLATGQALLKLTTDQQSFGAVAFSSDAKTVVTTDGGGIGGDSNLQFWDAKTGKEIDRIADILAGEANALALSSDGKYFVAAGPSEVIFGDAAARKKLAAYRPGSGSVALSFDGKLMAFASGHDNDGLVLIRDTATQKLVRSLRGHIDSINCMAFTRDNAKLATGGPEGTIRLWDVQSGREMATGIGHRAAINSVAFSPNGALAATVSETDHTIRLWSTVTGALEATMEIPFKRRVGSRLDDMREIPLTFSPDGKNVFCDRHVFDVSTGRIVSELPGLPGAHSADRRYIAGIQIGDTDDTAIYVWDRVTGREIGSFSPPGIEGLSLRHSSVISLSNDGRLLAIGVDDRLGRSRDRPPQETVYLYELPTGKLLHRFWLEYDGPGALAFSPDSELLVIAARRDERLQIWRVANGVMKSELRAKTERRHWEMGELSYPIAFSPDGKLLAAKGDGKKIVIYEVLTGKPVHTLAGQMSEVTSLAFSPDGRTLLSGGRDTQGVIWSLAPPGAKADLDADQLDTIWKQLAGDDAEGAYSALWALVAAPAKAVGMCKGRLKPFPDPDLKDIPGLIADLDADAFATRQAASKELGKYGPLIEGVLRQTLEGKPSPEVASRVKSLLVDIHRASVTPAELRQLRLIRVLEWLDTPAARAELEPLARGSLALRTTREAEAALRRLNARKPVDEKPASRSEPIPVPKPRALAELKAEPTAIAYFADGKILAVASADGRIRLIDPATAKELRQLGANEDAVCSIAFAPDGKTLASGGLDHEIHLWDVKTGESLQTFKGHFRGVSSVAFTPDGQMLASGSLDRTVRFWDPKTGKCLKTLDDHPGRVTSISFSSDGKTLACGYTLEGVFNIDRGRMVLIIYWSYRTRLWDVGTGKELRQLPGAGQHCVLCPDGRHLATAELRTEIICGNTGFRIRSGNSNIYGISWEPVFKGSATIALWDIATGENRLWFTGSGTAIAFSPNGYYLATAGASDLLEERKILQPPNVVPTDSRLRLWEVGSGQEVRAFPTDSQATVLAFSPDGRNLVTSAKDGSMRLWDVSPPTDAAKATDLSAKEFEGTWAKLAGDDAVAAYKAQLALQAAANKAIRFLAIQMRPVTADDPKVARLLLDVEADSFAVREGALVELRRMGTDAEPAITAVLKQRPSPALRTRLLVLRGASTLPQQADTLARVRAIEFLETVGTPQARELLQTLAKGPPLLQQTQAARVALERLAKRGESGEK